MPWLSICDFNELLHFHDHDIVGRCSQALLDGFSDALDVCGLVDLGYSGASCTFEKKVVGGIFTRVRLDCGVASPEWNAVFPSAHLKHKLEASSNHLLILLKFMEECVLSNTPWPFKYEVIWDTHPDLASFVGTGWKQKPVSNIFTELHEKLCYISGELATWD